MNMEFMNLYRKAKIVQDKSIIEELYQKSDNNRLDGKDDPNITEIKIVPTDAHYWDIKNNRLVSLLKMGLGAITGK